MKYLKFIIIFVIIIIIALIAILINISNKDNNNTVSENNVNIHNAILLNNSIVNTTNNITHEEGPSREEIGNYGDKITITQKVEKVTSSNMFYIIEGAVQSYINNISNRDVNALYGQLSTSYIINNGIDTSNILSYVNNISDTQKFRALKMSCVSGEVYNQYSIYGKLLNNTGNTTEIYLIVNINSGSLNYSIVPQINKNYTDISQVKIGLTDEQIVKNSYNQAKYKKVPEEDIIKNIINDYKLNALYDTQSAYKSLDSEYSKARFKDYSDYFNYVKNNESKIQELNFVSYNKTSKTGYTQYTCKDTYENSYTIKSTGIMEYTIILDDYTLENNLAYESMTNEEKVKDNINKIVKMLNTCDYTHLYKVLNNNFKTNYFETQSNFENYAKTNFYEYNIIDSIEIKESEENIYICTIRLKDRVSVAANTMDKTIIMKLGTGTSFEMSFNV